MVYDDMGDDGWKDCLQSAKHALAHENHYTRLTAYYGGARRCACAWGSGHDEAAMVT